MITIHTNGIIKYKDIWIFKEEVIIVIIVKLLLSLF